MGFPSKQEIKKVLKELENAKGSLALDPDATPLEKFRYDICQMFLTYKLEHKLNQKQLSELIGVDEPKISKILRYRISEFSTDRLIELYQKLDPHIKLKIG